MIIQVSKHLQEFRQLISFRFLIIGLVSCSFFFLQSPCTYASDNSTAARAWVDVEVLSFDGEAMSLKLIMNVVGNYANKSVWIHGEFSSSRNGWASVSIDVGRFVSDVMYSSDRNTTTFQYSYAYDFTYYRAEPRLSFLGTDWLIFPWDVHGLVLYITTNFNVAIDEHDRVALLPSENYVGVYKVRKQPMENNQYKFKLTLEIKHSSAFITSTSILVWGTLVSFILLTISLFTFLATHWKNNRHFVNIIVPISSAIIVFIPVFELSFQSLKSPLPIVLSDVFYFSLIPWNALILLVTLIKRRKKTT